MISTILLILIVVVCILIIYSLFSTKEHAINVSPSKKSTQKPPQCITNPMAKDIYTRIANSIKKMTAPIYITYGEYLQSASGACVKPDSPAQFQAKKQKIFDDKAKSYTKIVNNAKAVAQDVVNLINYINPSSNVINPSLNVIDLSSNAMNPSLNVMNSSPSDIAMLYLNIIKELPTKFPLKLADVENFVLRSMSLQDLSNSPHSPSQNGDIIKNELINSFVKKFIGNNFKLKKAIDKMNEVTHSTFGYTSKNGAVPITTADGVPVDISQGGASVDSTNFTTINSLA